MTIKAAFLGLLTLAGSAVAQHTYTIDDAHSSAQFSVRHMMISNVKGEFSSMKGTVYYDPKNVSASRIEAVIDANTINTRNAKRDAHLKNPDFFDTDKFPTLTFKSKQVWKAGDKLQVKGDLTMHGVTREVVLDVDGPTPEVKAGDSFKFGAAATTKLNRKDWGLTWNRPLEAGGLVVGDEVTITLDIQAVRKAAAPASN